MIFGSTHPTRQIRLQLPGMRKPDECVVYPRITNAPADTIQIQGARLIARFDAKTGAGMVNYKGSNPKYGMHLSPALGAIPWQFEPGFVLMCQELRPNSGDAIGPGVYIA